MTDIVTLTMNPALDISTTTDRVLATDKVRCGVPRRDPGGGGINVARVLTALGEPATAVFPSGGHSGRALEDLVASEGVRARTVTIRRSTRESFTVNEDRTGLQYRFVLPGPDLAAMEVDACLHALVSTAQGAAFVVASGSLPPGVPVDFFQTVADVVSGVGARLVVDTSGPPLRALRHGVYLLKPSIRELRDYIGHDLRSVDDQVAAARAIVDRGVCSVVVVSLGADGALHVTEEGAEHTPALHVPIVSGIGAGDSMVAGIVFGLTRGWELHDAVRYGVAAGAAAIGSPGTGLCDRAEVDRCYALLPGGGVGGV